MMQKTSVFERKAIDRLKRWKTESNGGTAMLIEGARRVGKSTLATEFGRQHYSSCLLVDFSTAPDDVLGYFRDLRNDLDTFFLYLSAFYGVKLHERDSLIIFDEVQLYPKAREAIKQLVADGRYDYVETGSLVSIRENVHDILIPSEEESMRLDPMDFDEFLWALGERPLADAIHTSFAKLTPLPDALHRKATRLFREYMLVGGMPQAVTAYARTHDFGAVDRTKRLILKLYREDIAKHGGTSQLRVTRIFDNLVSQLSKKEKRFNITSLGADARKRDYDDAFFWLSDAFVTNDCFNSTDPGVGLKISEDHSTVKCYMADTGLLVSLALADSDTTDSDVYRDVLLGNVGLNEGMIVENVVAQLLRTSGHRLFFYSRNDRKYAENRMEIDFLIVEPYKNAAMKARVSPIEVKSGKRYSTVSLNKFKAKFGHEVGTRYILHPKPLSVKDDVVRLPLYMAGLL
ncbi:AAA family ATPase [Bifidobacterium sp. ESL0690]|uniref:ATP-binding protein n=1 Tax=Bifidobacterium sp. ESL0690 TaxID=2983214 RepID=UPI0023F6BC52|nr:AAA family ATPase [Bifidobacterium sp. ESL0690]WEV46702.1 AAA family ATPase [Bifidobacterium sp. ESL0690]